MADLGLNSLWSDLSKGASNVQTDLMGPAYSYADHIPQPGDLGVGSSPTFDQLGKNTSAVGTYVGTMISSGPQGNQFFVNTGGTCTAPDGSLQSRHNYINNVASGLIPGVVGDIEGLNPMFLLNSLTSGSSPACSCYQCPVSSGGAYHFLTPNLSPDFDPSVCRVVDSANCPRVSASTESFTNAGTVFSLIIAGVAVGAILLLRK
jgi:hypothetical protein